MNLLEHYLVEEISVEDYTDKYLEMLKEFSPDAALSDRYLKVVWKVDCYGCIEVKTNYWTETEYNKYKLDGYYMA